MHGKLEEQRDAVLALPEHKVSRDGSSFISGLLEKTPKSRTSLGDALEHKWLSGAIAARSGGR